MRVIPAAYHGDHAEPIERVKKAGSSQDGA